MRRYSLARGTLLILCALIGMVGLSSCGGGGSGGSSPRVTIRPPGDFAADLVVGSPSVSDAGPDAGESFTLRATVRNRGDGRSGATTLRYYRSSDATITASDTAVGTDAVAGLAASGTSAESISVTAPSRAGTYYYGACVDSVSGESDTANNCSTGVRVIVSSGGGGNTFEVGDALPGVPTSGSFIPARLTGGASLSSSGGTTTVTFGNGGVMQLQDGTVYTCRASGGCQVRNGVVTRGEIVRGGGTPPPSGAADLVVGSPSVSDAGPDAGESFTLRATVRNRGDGRSGATTLRYYRSSDATITASDTAVGTDAVAGLAASGTSAESISVTAPSRAGTYYYGACVDSVSGESDTANNCSTGVRVIVSSGGGGNTFEVGDALPGVPTSGSFIPARLTGGASLSSSGGTTTVTFGNGGVMQLQDGTVYTCRASGGCQVRNGVVTRGEIVRGGGTPPPSGAADLVVGSPSVSDAGPDAGESFTLRATVRNRGDGRSGATTLRYYRSSDATITASDTAVGTDAVAGLAASGTSAESISVTAPSRAGTYYYGACVDSVSGESDTANNCSTGVRVIVSSGGGGNTFEVGDALPGVPTSGSFIPARLTGGASLSSSGGTTTVTFGNGGVMQLQDGTVYTCRASGGCQVRNGVVTRGEIVRGGGTPPPSGAADLVVGSPSVSDAGPDAGESFTLRATVRNRGDGRSGATTLRYYRSSDATITASDTAVGTDAVAGLAASGTSAESISVTAPSRAGTYYYGACVDSVSGESDTANNCSTGVRVIVSSGGGGNTFEVGDALPGVPTSGSFIPARLTGGASLSSSGGTTTVTFGNGGVMQLQDGTVYTCRASGGCQVRNGVVTRGEIVRGGGTPPPSGAADLVVGSPSVSDAGPDAGESFTLRATVRNRGDGRSGATTLRYYRSSDATITASDTAVGTDAVAGLAASGTSAESISVTAPSRAGTYYYGACVDSVSGESDTANNCSTGVRVIVSSGGGGNTFEVGDALPGVPTSGSFIPARLTGGASLSSSGGTTTVTFGNGGVMQLQDGTVYTCRASGGCQVRNGVVTRGEIVRGGGTPPPSGAADLVVGSPSVSDAGPDAGESFTLRATVRNRGDGRSGATTLRYYRSSDATITASDTAVGTDAVAGLAASGTSAESISVTAPSRAGTYYYGACVDSVSGEWDTANNCSTGVRVIVQGSSGPAVVGNLSECTGTRTSFLAVAVTIRGTIQANRSVTALRIDGYANGQFIDSEFVGTMSSGLSRNFNLTGTLLDSSATRVDCRVELDWLERQSQGGAVRGKSSMPGPSQGL